MASESYRGTVNAPERPAVRTLTLSGARAVSVGVTDEPEFLYLTTVFALLFVSGVGLLFRG